ncbi:MAG: hypothetical protein COZ08_01770 [Bacteroidetes bacterium CG_4_10_14_3_um_filter_42_6]|nr:MAG: hypothetical protein COZ08_01770 [Bacteroidetes bacterium CG_4_10_14_3_um_filter_42_6]
MTLPEILKTPGGSQMFLKIILGLAASIGLIFFYFLPSVIAQKRKHPQAVPIKIINTFFGWTLIGWVISLAWAHSSAPVVQPSPLPHRSR